MDDVRLKARYLSRLDSLIEEHGYEPREIFTKDTPDDVLIREIEMITGEPLAPVEKVGECNNAGCKCIDLDVDICSYLICSRAANRIGGDECDDFCETCDWFNLETRNGCKCVPVDAETALCVHHRTLEICLELQREVDEILGDPCKGTNELYQRCRQRLYSLFTQPVYRNITRHWLEMMDRMGIGGEIMGRFMVDCICHKSLGEKIEKTKRMIQKCKTGSVYCKWHNCFTPYISK